jgi:glycerate dehydrogenase
MNIVVLDGYTLNPGDLDWGVFERIGRLTVHDRTPVEEIAFRAREADAVLVNKTVLSAETLRSLPRLKYIGVLATGYNNIDMAAAAERGIVVANVPDYSTASVAQMTFALLLELAVHVQRHGDAVRAGDWSASPDFCFTRSALVELAGKTFGIVGYGSIGRQVHRIAAAFGMRVLITSRSRYDAENAEWVSMEDLFARSDVVSLHCPLTEHTAGLVSRERLALMKPSAFLINTSRGGLIVEADLAEALNSGRIAGAAVDVLSKEPPSPDNPLLHAKNCLVTPHIAWATREARERLMKIAAENLQAFIAGSPRNVVRAP